MIAYKLCLFILFFLGWFISYRRNSDLFSPIKLYIYYSLFFYFSIYFSNVSFPVLVIYSSLLLSILILIPYEKRSSTEIEPCFNFEFRNAPNKGYLILWGLTIPGVIIKTWLVYEAGGLSGYLDSLAFRVSNWKGQGHLIVLLGIIPALSLIYFTLLIKDGAVSRLKWVGFFVHFSIFIAIGLLMGSRSFIAIPLLGYLLSYSYFKRRVSFSVVFVFFVFLVILIGVLGSFRNSFNSNVHNLSSWVSSFELAHFYYGVNPLEIVFSSKTHPMVMGESYFSLFTNIFPRSIFEDKLQTGGITFTQYYTNDQWAGMSHLAPSAVGEAVMNFGVFFGVIVGVFLTLVVMFLGVLFYNKFYLSVLECRANYSKIKSAVMFVCYFYFILLAARFSFAEFTNVFFSYFIYSLIPVFIFYSFSSLSLKYPPIRLESTKNRA